nr:hypothetical protein [Gammaproteobacteria bacterium]
MRTGYPRGGVTSMMRPQRRATPVQVKAAAYGERAWPRIWLWLCSGLVAGALLLLNWRADAGTALCETGRCSTGTHEQPMRYSRLATALPGSPFARASHESELSEQEFSSFSGVGMIVCTVDGVSRSSTAFLVGAFDIAVTVAHTFESRSGKPASCVYNSTDMMGQIRERIPVAYVKSQWDMEPGAAGEPTKDLAVVRLAQPSRFAHRTMPLGRFSGDGRRVVMVGFKELSHSDTFKQKKHGSVYDFLGTHTGVRGAFAHDMDSQHITPGAPVIDERTGIIIGIHTRLGQRSNTMITMNDWLEATIRAELQRETQEAARAN